MGDAYRRKVDDYATRYPDEATPLAHLMLQQERNVTRFSYSNAAEDEQPHTLAALLSLVERDRTSSRKAVCVIENISPACIETIGTAWAIEPDFFAMHASNPL